MPLLIARRPEAEARRRRELLAELGLGPRATPARRAVGRRAAARGRRARPVAAPEALLADEPTRQPRPERATAARAAARVSNGDRGSPWWSCTTTSGSARRGHRRSALERRALRVVCDRIHSDLGEGQSEKRCSSGTRSGRDG
jgi:predicted ABC-type transport system involved in lysophospholipase L1 biosynthesis ATPase subunit